MRIVLQRRWAAPAAPPARVVVSFHHSGGLRAEPLEASQLGTSHILILDGNLAILAGFADYVGRWAGCRPGDGAPLAHPSIASSAGDGALRHRQF